MPEYKKFDRAGGFKPRTSSRPSFPTKDLYDAECNKCHNRCQVPFRPNGKKPVFCSNCFVKDEGFDSRGSSSFSRESRPAPRSFAPEAPNREMQELKKEIATLTETVQKLITVIEKSNRASALTEEIQKHIPTEETAPKKKPAAKKVAKAKK